MVITWQLLAIFDYFIDNRKLTDTAHVDVKKVDNFRWTDVVLPSNANRYQICRQLVLILFEASTPDGVNGEE